MGRGRSRKVGDGEWEGLGMGRWREWMEGVKWEDGGLMGEEGMSGVGLIEGRMRRNG